MHIKPNNFPVLSSRANSILTTENRQEIMDFTRELEEAVRDIVLAAKQSSDVSKKVGALMNSLESRSWWGQVTSGFSGGTDKELATLVQGLGASLAITQKVVQVVLKVMTGKNQLLHGFNEALVNKIAMVTADTRTLDSNQKIVVKDFLTKLQKQVFDQIQQQELVDSLELRLIDCEAWREEKECHDQLVTSQLATQGESQKLATERILVMEGIAKALADRTDQLAKLQISDGMRITELDESQKLATARILVMEGSTQALADRTDQLAQLQTSDSMRITELERETQAVTDRQEASDGYNQVQAGRVAVLEAKCADLAEQVRILTERTDALKTGLEQYYGQIAQLQRVDVEQRTLIYDFEQRLSVLEKIDNASRSIKARILKYAPVAAASLLGGVAVYLSLAT